MSAIYVERHEIESYAGVKVGDSIHTVYKKHNHKIPEIRRNEYSNQPIGIALKETLVLVMTLKKVRFIASK